MEDISGSFELGRSAATCQGKLATYNPVKPCVNRGIRRLLDIEISSMQLKRTLSSLPADIFNPLNLMLRRQRVLRKLCSALLIRMNGMLCDII
jgi:hypothetical protein